MGLFEHKVKAVVGRDCVVGSDCAARASSPPFTGSVQTLGTVPPLCAKTQPMIASDATAQRAPRCRLDHPQF